VVAAAKDFREPQVEAQNLRRARCRHCDTPSGGAEFCCAGCATVFELLHREGLSRYYDLRARAGSAPVTPPAAEHKWLELAAADLAARAEPARLVLDIQGLRCAACVWLVDELFRRTQGGLRCVVNPALGVLELCVTPGFALVDFVTHVERFGYRIGPARKTERPSSGLHARLGVCVAIAMNSMIFAIAIYAGADGDARQLFARLDLALASLSVVVGGSLFIGSAARALRRGIVHMDLPLALGIVLAYAGSVVSFARGGGAEYFDTLNVFIALMLVGRWLQERVLERNRRLLLADDGAAGLLTRRLEDGVARVVPCRLIAAGDRLLIAPGDLVPVDAVAGEPASCSLDWISGESRPRGFDAGATIPAGAVNAGRAAFTATAATAFAPSPIVALLRTTVDRAADLARATPWWRRLARVYTGAVLCAAAGGFILSLALGRGVGRALDVTAAVLIVTCPCALGIATPLAYELVQAGLRRAGLYVRSAGFLYRARAVTRVVFDKTGTLTTGALTLADPAELLGLAPADRQALYNLCCRSAHPRSAAIARALEALPDPPRFTDGLDVRETPGVGLEVGRYRLDGAFRKDGRPLATLAAAEVLRPDAAAEVAALARDHEVWILSGDRQGRVDALARTVGVPPERALGERSPAAKADWLAAHDRGDTLVVGDGLNDSLAVERATCSGTPAIDRPFLPARSDFYFTTPGLGPIRLALDAARALAAVTRTNLALAVTTNVVAVALAYAGLVSPVVCAVYMPLSSLAVVSATVAALGPRRKLWPC
jgi:Cu2+-exporting ATPase